MSIFQFLKWEFWPFWLFYLPLLPYYLWLAFRARSWVFFAAANPLMVLGGMVNYSKYRVLEQIDPALRPMMELRRPPFASRQKPMMGFPLVAKPDKGERGRGVSFVHSQAELDDYLRAATGDVILQAAVEWPLEFGLMYYRLPSAKNGEVTSLMQRDFLSVVGDGKRTVSALLQASERNRRYAAAIAERYPQSAQRVPEMGEVVLVEPIGNHCRGTTFRDACHLITPQLTQVFDRISLPIEGYFFGRYDLKAQSLEDLYAGRVQILELNGANSEPAHIYDPQNSLWRAYRDLYAHWKNLFLVSRANHQNGVPYPSLSQVWQQWHG
ncbi:MAG: hypothetical protein ACFCUI_04275 [Bernardetiaceae bacterium]